MLQVRNSVFYLEPFPVIIQIVVEPKDLREQYEITSDEFKHAKDTVNQIVDADAFTEIILKFLKITEFEAQWKPK